MSLPRDRRLRRGPDITQAVRRGRRARSGALVVHVRRRGTDGTGTNGLRVAFVAPRTVGTAVVRNRTRRRTQALLLELGRTEGLDLAGAGTHGPARDQARDQTQDQARDRAHETDLDVVIRLLPGSGDVSHAELRSALRRALLQAGVPLSGGRTVSRAGR